MIYVKPLVVQLSGIMAEDFSPVCGEEILHVSNLSVNRSGNEIINDINMSITCGEFVGIVGPNGGGKSTLILTILGLLKPRTGSVNVYGKTPMSNATLGRIGWVPQAATELPHNLRITVKEFIQLGLLSSSFLKQHLDFFISPTVFFKRRKKNQLKVENIIETVGLKQYANTMISNLSGGQRQRAAIGKALASEADFLLMDEPMVGVDLESRNSIMRLLDNLCHNQNKTIVMVSHDLASMKRTVHRMIYLEHEIRYDGTTEDFPDLSSLAELRGIEPTHPEADSTKSDVTKSDDVVIIVSPGAEGGES